MTLTMAGDPVQRRLSDFQNRCGDYGQAALHLAYHAALPVALNAELLHLLRINFFLDSPETLPYTVEFDFLLSPLCQEIDEGLYEIEREIRNALLVGLKQTYDTHRIHDVAKLLWQYVSLHSPWRNHIELKRAQQLTALYFLNPEKAKQWLVETETELCQEQAPTREWLVVMQQEIENQEKLRQEVKDTVSQRKERSLQQVDDRKKNPEISEKNGKVHTQLELLNEVIRQTLLPKEGGTSKNLMLFIRRSLSQMQLGNEWDENEILVEAYIRTRERINSGEIIDNLSGYLAKFAQLIIFEKNRQRKRTYGISQKLSSFQNVVSLPESSYEEGVSYEVIDSLWSSFGFLPEKDQQILNLRIVKGYSWNEIAYQLVELGIEESYDKALVSKLRKQGERALEKLRKGILSIDIDR